MVTIMIDKIINWLVDNIVSNFLPSTLLKSAIIALIVSLLLSLVIGYGVIIITLVVVQLLWLVNEYLYAKSEEDSDSDETSYNER